MTLPVTPPVAPMLARLARQLPEGDYAYEPKWDGFRCLAFRDGHVVDLRSRNDRPLARYFPDVVAALMKLPAPRFVVDGELLVVRDGRADFESLMARLHPAAARATLLSEATPASYVLFDVLAVGDVDMTSWGFRPRRDRLDDTAAAAPAPLFVTPSTTDPAVAGVWLDRAVGGGIDGVVAKAGDVAYRPGKRAMVKVKHERTADCVVAGARLFEQPLGVASLILGLHDDEGVLRHVGVASGFARDRRRALVHDIAPHVVDLDKHPWRDGFGHASGRAARLPGAATRWAPDMDLDWLLLRPELVCEVAYDHIENGLLRHPARFRRWRPDRDPASCGFDQLVEAGDLTGLLPS